MALLDFLIMFSCIGGSYGMARRVLITYTPLHRMILAWYVLVICCSLFPNVH